MSLLPFFAALTIPALIHVLIALLILVIIGWIILAILGAIGAPPIARQIVLVIGGLIAILLLLNLIYPLGF